MRNSDVRGGGGEEVGKPKCFKQFFFINKKKTTDTISLIHESQIPMNQRAPAN